MIPSTEVSWEFRPTDHPKLEYRPPLIPCSRGWTSLSPPDPSILYSGGCDHGPGDVWETGVVYRWQKCEKKVGSFDKNWRGEKGDIELYFKN